MTKRKIKAAKEGAKCLKKAPLSGCWQMVCSFFTLCGQDGIFFYKCIESTQKPPKFKAENTDFQVQIEPLRF